MSAITAEVDDGSLFHVFEDRMYNMLRIINPDGGDEVVEIIEVNGNTLTIVRSSHDQSAA